MAIFYGVQTARRRNTVPVRLVEQGFHNGHLRIMEDVFTLTGDLAGSAVDFISVGLLPQGARVIDVRVAWDDLDVTGGTIDVGWRAGAAGVEAASVEGFATNLDVTVAGVYSMFTSNRTRPGFGKTFNEAVEVVVTIDGDTDATTGQIYVQVLYVID